MNKNVLYHHFGYWGMEMDGCEGAALDDAARSFRFGNMPSIWPSWPGFMLLGSVFIGKKMNYIY